MTLNSEIRDAWDGEKFGFDPEDRPPTKTNPGGTD